MNPKGMSALLDEVIRPGFCVTCGGCVGLCPYLNYFEGKVVCVDRCDLEKGRCYEICPRVPRDRAYTDAQPIGPVRIVVKARSTDKARRERSQYGGTVTELVGLALREGMIKGAVLTTPENGSWPRGALARDLEEAARCSGSRYTASGSLEVFNREAKKDAGPLGVVGLPCQAGSLALAKSSPLTYEETRRSIGLVIGLFCTWALSYRPFRDFLAREGFGSEIRSYDIPPPPANIFQIFSDNGVREYPLDRIRGMIQPGCLQCPDMTAEQADLSVGAVEGITGWNTLIVRTEAGAELLDRAVAAEVLELGELPQASIDHLAEASLLKRKRGIARQKEILATDAHD